MSMPMDAATHDDPNFVTSCNKCNMRKSAGSAEKFSSRLPLVPIKGKYGEPVHWDGFVGAVHSFGGA